MDKMKFSFVIPVYNVQDFLERCVDSVLRQTCDEFEIVLVDDGSRDKSGELCDIYAEKYASVKVIHKENGGLSSARNTGIDHAEGQYIFFLDSDDYVGETLCERLSEVVEKYGNPDVISIDGWEEENGQKSNMRRLPIDTERCVSGETYLIERYQQRNMNVEACLYVFRREFLNNGEFCFVNGILHEDVEFTPRVIEQAEKVVEIPDGFYHYMIRENSISTKRNKEKNIRDLFHTLECMNDRAEYMKNPELARWTKDAVLNSYLSMVQEARMYRREYRSLLDKKFLKGKAVTRQNQLRVLLCCFSVRLYCIVNDLSKWLKNDM